MKATRTAQELDPPGRHSRRPGGRWGELFRRRRMDDPLLIFNMSIFNTGDGWNRIFSDRKIYENVT